MRKISPASFMSSITSLLQICATDLNALFALPALSEATPTPAIVYGKQCPSMEFYSLLVVC